MTSLRRRIELLERGGETKADEDGWRFCIDDYLTTPGRESYSEFPPLLAEYLASRPNMLEKVERLINDGPAAAEGTAEKLPEGPGDDGADLAARRPDAGALPSPLQAVPQLGGDKAAVRQVAKPDPGAGIPTGQVVGVIFRLPGCDPLDGFDLPQRPESEGAPEQADAVAVLVE